MTENDLKRLVRFFLEQNCTIIPDIIYDRPVIMPITNLDSFVTQREIQSCAQYFILNTDWQVAPLEFGSYDKQGKRVYFIRQKTGGPTLDIFAPYEYVASQVPLLPHGFVAYHKSYWNPQSQQNEQSSSTLRDIYFCAVELLRQDAEVLRGKNVIYIVASDTRKRIEDGVCLGAPFRKTKKNKGDAAF